VKVNQASPWGQFELYIFPWTSVNETLIYDKSNILQTSYQIKLWNFLLQLEMTKKSLNVLSESYIFCRHCVEKTKTNWLQIGRSRWPELNFLSLCSKIWSQCGYKGYRPISKVHSESWGPYWYSRHLGDWWGAF